MTPRDGLFPIIGILYLYASALAKLTPIKREGIRPGPIVTAIKSILVIGILVSWRACRRQGSIFFRCSRAARFGTTPPNGAWVLICEDTTFDKISKIGFLSPEALITAIPVSSQDVSTPRISIISSSAIGNRTRITGLKSRCPNR